MKLLSHHNPEDQEQLRDIDDNFSFQFLREFSDFCRYYYHQSLFLLYSPEFDAYLPLRIINSRVARLGQIFHPPIHDCETLVPKDQLIFFNMMLRFIRKEKLCDRLIQPHPFSILGALPPHVKYCEFGTYVIELQEQTMEQVFSHYTPKYQKAIRHSIRHQARVEASWDVFDDFYRAYENTMRRVGMEMEPRAYFLGLRTHLGKYAIPAVVYDGDRAVGSAFFLYTRYAAYCTHAGSMEGSKLYGAMKLLHYRMMQFMKERGVKRYDLVGVRLKNTDPALEGVFRFKKGFGGDLRAGYLWKTDIHPWRGRLLDLFLQWRPGGRRPQKDIIDQSA
jgi:hypothetical protein